MVDILPPLISRFRFAHPAASVELVVDDRLTDTIAQGCAAGIRYVEHLAQDMIAIAIGPNFGSWPSLQHHRIYQHTVILLIPPM